MVGGRKLVIKRDLFEPAFIMANEGESVNITCNITVGKLDGMYLKREVISAMDVLYVPNNAISHTKDRSYKDRLDSSVLLTEVRITLHRLQKNDTDVYICSGSVLVDFNPKIVVGQGTMLVLRQGWREGMFLYIVSMGEHSVCVTSVSGCSKSESKMLLFLSKQATPRKQRPCISVSPDTTVTLPRICSSGIQL
uniref:Immunoglobulin domain-containing protein n=1 Tax=Pelusios castaneus TaxID=367368 RepID=A0A8C8VQH3_9SAUR